MYQPPLKITARIVNLIAEISAMTERYAIYLERENGLMLRKINRIKTIQGSLAIEGNTLDESMITDILNGKKVVAPIKEIQEVKNAIKTYELYPVLDPYNIKDLLKAHSVMMQILTDDAGKFRKTNVGVFSGKQAVHIAPPPDRVPFLMQDLFDWLCNAEEHLLIRSCVFHYEFEFIHPFSDGNGRMGRLWQSLILGKWHPLFEHLPVENIVYANQQNYYKAINDSTAQNDSGIFTEFMLEKILETLNERKNSFTQENTQENTQEMILNLIRQNKNITRRELALILQKSEDSIKYHLHKLVKQNIIKHQGSTKSGWWEIITAK